VHLLDILRDGVLVKKKEKKKEAKIVVAVVVGAVSLV
jgi:hypothetical protein